MATVISILGALIVLSVLVFFHELGHYGMGRLLKFRIMEFAIGMGPVLLKKVKNGIQYSIRALPIGGMCRFYGEDEGVSDSECFNAQKPWKRILVVIAGPIMNILFALIFASVTLMTYGDYVPQIASFEEDSPAREAGIREGDIIYAIDGDRIDYFNETVGKIRAADGESAVITLERGEEIIELTVHDMYDAEKGYNYLGISIQAARKQYAFFPAVGHSFTYVTSVIEETLGALKNTFVNGFKSDQWMGPFQIINTIATAVRSSFETVLRLAVLLSISLGLMNILPIPALDGGRLVFLIIEWIRGKPIAPEKEGMVHLIGMVLLLGFIIYLSVVDIIAIVGG